MALSPHDIIAKDVWFPVNTMGTTSNNPTQKK